MNLEQLQKAKGLKSEILRLKEILKLFRQAEHKEGFISLYDSQGKSLLEITLLEEELNLIISNKFKFIEENISRLEHELEIL